MRIVVAAGAFKGSLTAREVCDHAAAGVRDAVPDAEVMTIPAADGGDDSLEVLLSSGAREVLVTVSGPTGDPVDTSYASVDAGSAFVEMASTCGLLLLPDGQPAPLTASSRGLGDAIRAALDAGHRRIHVGIGGSASTDGGSGMAAALGVRFLDADGRTIPDGGATLASLAEIDLSGLDSRVLESEIVVACDVDNPLLGPRGAARVFGPQKGASPAEIEMLEQGLSQLAHVAGSDAHGGVPSADVAHVDTHGAGAAGGVGFGAMTFLGARLSPGFDLLAELSGLPKAVAGADLVLTGEGRLDAQSLGGKTPVAVARLAAEHGVPCVAVCGSNELSTQEAAQAGFTRVSALTEWEQDTDRAMTYAARLIRRASSGVVMAPPDPTP